MPLFPLITTIILWYGFKFITQDDGVVLNIHSIPGGAYIGFNLGRTLTHEVPKVLMLQVGHWLGLYHTFQGGCSWPNDFVADTIPQAGPTFGCPKPQTTCSMEKFHRSDKFSWSMVSHLTDSNTNFMGIS